MLKLSEYISKLEELRVIYGGDTVVVTQENHTLSDYVVSPALPRAIRASRSLVAPVYVRNDFDFENNYDAETVIFV